MKTKIPNAGGGQGKREFFLLALWVILGVLSAAVVASPADILNKKPGATGNPWSSQKIIEARNAVEFAWEVYHDAALGGTLASPAVQSELESELHECRHLLAEAYAAAENKDWNQVNTLHNQILALSHHVVKASQDPKS